MHGHRAQDARQRDSKRRHGLHIKPLRAFISVSSVFEFECNSVEGRLAVVGEAGLKPEQ